MGSVLAIGAAATKNELSTSASRRGIRKDRHLNLNILSSEKDCPQVNMRILNADLEPK